MPTPPKVAVSVGAALLDKKMIMAVILGGVNIFRIQQVKFSFEESVAYAKLARQIAFEQNKPIEILFDYSGERKRIGTLPANLTLQAGDIVSFARQESGTGKENIPLPINEDDWAKLKVDERIYVADGATQVRIRDIGPNRLTAIVEISSAPIKTDDDINFPDSNIQTNPVGPREREDLLRIAALKLVDWISLSFIEEPLSIIEAKRLLGEEVKVMAKIESERGVEHIDAIASVADGIMIARGDLAIQAPMERLGIYERKLVKSAKAAGKPVMMATQFLESMVSNPIPLRAELSDVATAAILGVDSILLTKEIAIGAYPLRALAVAKGTLAYTAAHKNEVE